MELITDLLNFLIALVKSWKFIYHFVLISLAVLTSLFEFGTKTKQLNLPLWIIFIISILAFYPIVNFFVYLLNHRKISYKKLYGLLWKKPLLPFVNPNPYCPRENCGCKVVYRVLAPKRNHKITSLLEFKNMDFEYHYHYVCPVHGLLSGIPDEDIAYLQKKAKLAMKKQ